MKYAIIHRMNEYTRDGNELIHRAVFGLFNSRKEAEEYNNRFFAFPEYNLIVPFHPATEED